MVTNNDWESLVECVDRDDVVGFSETVNALGITLSEIQDGPPNSWMTFLTLAAECGRVNMIHYLIDRGADPNHLTRSVSWSPLYFAVEAGCDEAVKVLLARGASPDACMPGMYSARLLARTHPKYARFLTMFQEMS